MLLVLSVIVSCSKDIPFDREIWLTDKSIESIDNGLTQRQKMTDSILSQIKGKTRNDIILMLGEETSTDKFQDDADNLIYVMGPERSYFSIDYEWLSLSFDADDVLIIAELITD